MVENRDKKFVINVEYNNLTSGNLEKLEKVLCEFPENSDICLDFSKVETIENDFLRELKSIIGEYKISLINLSAEIFALLNLTGTEKFVKIYLTGSDYMNSNRELKNRRFTV